MQSVQLASKTFGPDDQSLFVRMSGDCNPIHTDAEAARRTQAGATVVHGVHAALWALDEVVKVGIVTNRIAALEVRFAKFIFVGSTVDLKLVHSDLNSIRAELCCGDLTTTTLVLRIGAPKVSSAVSLEGCSSIVIESDQPASFSRLEELAGLSGCLRALGPPQEIEQRFPHAASALGLGCIIGIVQLSKLVGMCCPGLNSLFASFVINFMERSATQDHVFFRVAETDERFRLVKMAVCGDGFAGTVQAFLRWPPVTQAAVSHVATLVDATEFAGTTALIVGGSRGLGALTAKVIATGGGKAIVTYATGRKEALELIEEINSLTADDVCRAVPYDALHEADDQLKEVDTKITHLYYFATTSIFRQKEELFVPRLLDEFVQMYVKGFYDCCRVVSGQWSRRITAYYPSSVALEENAMDLAEYCMAKAAGETLCSAMNRSKARIRVVVSRLPRLLTDQTATVAPVANGDPLKVLLPIIRKVQSLGSE